MLYQQRGRLNHGKPMNNRKYYYDQIHQSKIINTAAVLVLISALYEVFEFHYLKNGFLYGKISHLVIEKRNTLESLI